MDYFIIITLSIALLLIAAPVAIYTKEYLRLRKMTYDELLDEAETLGSMSKSWQNDRYEFREIMRPKYYGLCGAVKVRQRRELSSYKWEDI
jgi:hypothetical protein